jgi:hypothetical protein
MDIEKKRGRILWVSKYNGGSVAVLGVLCLLCSLLWFTLVGILIGLALLASAYMELSGRRRLKQSMPEAGRWLARSQLLLMTAIILYSAYNLLLFDPVREMKNEISDLPPETRTQLSQALDMQSMEELVPGVFRDFYLALIAGTVLYQGGLWLYYTRATRKLEQAAAAESRGKMKT